MLSLRNITLARGNKVLLKDVTMNLYAKQKIGLIGHNGCGKSSFFNLILGRLSTDSGDLLINPKLSISYLSQHLPDSEEQALEFVLAGDTEYVALQTKLQQAERLGKDAQVLACHEQLTQTGGYSKPAQAAAIMSGLGFSNSDQQKDVNSFSGGWRMRLSLARCLMKPADLLLLDEPTNHLDLEAILWLERFLKQSPATIILIAHDREFLDAVASHIMHIEQQNMTLYKGNYSRFEIMHAQQLALQQSMYEKQQTKIKHMMSFVTRFKAKATKAKQAQGRLKAIEKMEIIAAAQVDSPFSFEFYPCQKAGNPLLQCEHISAGYDTNKPIIKKIDFTLNNGDRIAFLGPNGEGKSTLIKTLTGTLPVLDGIIHKSAHLKIGYYAQHQLEDLDNALSPLATIQKISPHEREQTIRDFLGGFNFKGDSAVNPIHHFSGGEKARLALAKLVWQKPNLLLLDEPTNHLDIEMRAAIELALQSYEGALILISHDRHMVRSSVDQLYLIYQHKLTAFSGDLDDYYSWLQNKPAVNETKSNEVNISHKEKKALQNRVKKLEQIIIDSQKQLHQLDDQLSNSALYEDDAKQNELKKLLDQRDTTHNDLTAAEEEWLELNELLD